MVIPLSVAEARTYAAASCFNAGPVGRVGVELEWLVYDTANPSRRIPLSELRTALAMLPATLPGGSLVTIEPGGQVELSSAPGSCLSSCADATAADLSILRSVLGAAGLHLVGAGLDAARVPQRILDTPRYAALEAFYERLGADGLAMMANSASIQVCLDAGDDSDGPAGYRFRWWLADALGPMLMAAFANSPAWFGRRTGWRSTRQVFRFRTDPGRSRAPRLSADPRAAWARYALDARVVCVRGLSEDWSAPDSGMTFRHWLEGAGPRPATLEDLDYHLGTLFPPVRPRGYLELRMLDAQPGDGWIVPLAVVTALLDDPDAAQAAAELVPRRSVRRHADWMRAARYGLADPQLAASALGCFRVAQESLAGAGVPATIRDAVAEFTDRYPARGRCPADDAFLSATAEHQPT